MEKKPTLLGGMLSGFNKKSRHSSLRKWGRSGWLWLKNLKKMTYKLKCWFLESTRCACWAWSSTIRSDKKFLRRSACILRCWRTLRFCTTMWRTTNLLRRRWCTSWYQSCTFMRSTSWAQGTGWGSRNRDYRMLELTVSHLRLTSLLIIRKLGNLSCWWINRFKWRCTFWNKHQISIWCIMTSLEMRLCTEAMLV